MQWQDLPHRDDLAEVMPLGKAPSSSTRLSRAINFDQICKAFNEWMMQYFKEENIAIDGKSINSTVSSCHDSKFCEFSIFFRSKSNLACW